MKKKIFLLILIFSVLFVQTGIVYAADSIDEKIHSKGSIVYYEEDGKTESMVFDSKDIKTLYDRVAELSEKSVSAKKEIIKIVNESDNTGADLPDDATYDDIIQKIKGLSDQIKKIVEALNQLEDFQGADRIPDDATIDDLVKALSKIGTKYDNVPDIAMSENGEPRLRETLTAQPKDVLIGKKIYDGKTGTYITGTMPDHSFTSKTTEYLEKNGQIYEVKEGYYDGNLFICARGSSWKPTLTVEEYPGRTISNKGISAPENGEVVIDAGKFLDSDYLLSEAIVTIPSFDRLSAIPTMTMTEAGLTKNNSHSTTKDGKEINYGGNIEPAKAENISTGKAAWVNGRLIIGTGGDNKAYLEYNKELKTSRGSFTFYGHGSTTNVTLGKKPRVVVLYNCNAGHGGWVLSQFQIYDSTSNFKYRFMYNMSDKVKYDYTCDIKITDNGFSYTQNLGSDGDTIFLGAELNYYVIF